MIYLKTFKLSDSRITNNNIYPFNVLQNKEPDIFIFDNITVLYGNNGSGKSTILNIIAHKLNLKGKERSNPKVDGTLDYFEDYASKCEYELGENENGRKITRIPENSRYIKSEEILYEIRKIQQDAILQESIESNLARERGLQNAKNFLQTKEGGKQFARFEFSQDKYSNGETTMQILEDNIELDNLYLLDEPEVSLSPQNRVQLAEEINKMTRYLGVQFIIATHSPFMLGILNAKIYNLDTIDGTLRDSNRNLSAKTIEIIKRISEKGILVILCSGRPRKYTEQISRECFASKYIITSSGGNIYDYEQDKILYVNKMDKEAIIKLYEIANPQDVRFIMNVGEGRVVNKVKHPD